MVVVDAWPPFQNMSHTRTFFSLSHALLMALHPETKGQSTENVEQVIGHLRGFSGERSIPWAGQML
jgi:hypothetical protein